MKVAPIIVWIETDDDLREMESYTEYFFTADPTIEDACEEQHRYPLVYFCDFNVKHYVEQDFQEIPRYDLYEMSDTYKSLEEFKRLRYFGEAEVNNLTKLSKPSDMLVYFPEYCI